MKLLVEPKLIERVAFDAARADPLVRKEFERQRVACYGQPAELRERAFAELYDAWFRRLGFRAALESALDAHPRVAAGIERVIVSTATSARDQGVELFGDTGMHVLAIKVRPSTLLSAADFLLWAGRELLHADDMLDPAFAFDRSLRPTGPNMAMANLIRERYAVLWAISIDARLKERLAHSTEWITRRRSELARAFGLQDEADEVFEAAWIEFRTARPTHPSLIDRAQAGWPLSTPIPLRATAARRAPHGAVCPICGFSTFQWADLDSLPHLVSAIKSEFSSWEPKTGLCGRCAEVYQSFAVSATESLTSTPGD